MTTTSVGEPEYRLDGNLWEEYALQRLREKYAQFSQTEFVPVPAASQGDLGIDAFTRSSGVVYQCYAAEHYANAKDLYEHQRDKITDDLGKLIDPAKGKELIKLLGPGNVIREWILVVPQHRSKQLIQHANEKAEALRTGLNRPEFISQNFVVHIWTEIDLDIHCGVRTATLTDVPLLVKLRSPWSLKVHESSLWPPSTELQVRRDAARIADLCWAWATQPPDDEAVNPWRDDNYPMRAIDNLAALDGAIANLKVDEVSLLLVAPCLRQAVLTCAERKAWIDITPLRLDPLLNAGTPLRRQYEGFLAQHPQLERKARRLLDNGPEGEWVVWWILHQVLLRNPDVWKLAQNHLPTDFIAELKETLASLPILEPADQIMLLARSMAAEPEELLDRQDAYPRTVRPRNRTTTIRYALLSALLAVAGRQSFDPLLMPQVLVDHVGLSVPVSPEMVLRHVRQARWLKGENQPSLILDAICEHAAIDKAMEEEAKRLEIYRRTCLQAFDENPKGLDSLRDLPSFRADNLQPKGDKGADVAYVRPHVAFTLAQDEVRELLMGERLYGDPSLAIRELFQNALDACRYRETRLRFLARLSGEEENDLNWKGQIVFTQGRDAKRGAYIECRDNGVGMRHEDLLRCFAKAGRRFTDTEEYMDERAKWESFGLEHYPNSQFGIGVFSYFMLAEEIQITTRRIGADGRLEDDTLNVTVSGAGGLFHIRKNGTNLPKGGTTVRLHLNREHYTDSKGNAVPISVLEALRAQLWIADYLTVAREADHEERWEPGVLRADFRVPLGHRNPAPAVIPADEDIWWVEEDLHHTSGDYNGRLLVDGIVTEERVPAVIFNLHGKNRPRLTVDRRHVLDWPRNALQVCLKERGWRALLKSPFTNYESFIFAASFYPVSIQRFLDVLEKEVNLEYHSLYGKAEYDLSKVGIFPPDADLDNLRSYDRRMDLLENWVSKLNFWPHNLLVYRLKILTTSGNWPKYIFEWISRNEVDCTAPRLGPIHSMTRAPNSGLYFDFSPKPELISAEFGMSYEEILCALQPAQALGIVPRKQLPPKDQREWTIKNAYRNQNLAINWALIGSGTIDTIDVELLAEDDDFPSPTIPPWRVIAIRASGRLSRNELRARLERWADRGINVPWEALDLNNDLSPQDQDLFAPPFTLPPGQTQVVHTLIARAVENRHPMERMQKDFARLAELGLSFPPSIEAIIASMDDVDRGIIAKCKGAGAILGRLFIEEIAANKLRLETVAERVAKYQSAGFKTAETDFSMLKDQEDAIAVKAMLPQMFFLARTFAEGLQKGITVEHAKQALAWAAANGSYIPPIDWNVVTSAHFDELDFSILSHLNFTPEVNYDVLAAAVVMYSLSESDLQERLRRYRSIGVQVPEIESFGKTFAFLAVP